MTDGVNTRSWQMTLPTAITVWAIIVAAAAIAGVWLGYSGRQFAIALTVAAALFAFEFWLAAPKVLSRAQTFLGSLAPIVPLAAVILYSLGVTGSGRWLIAGAGYAVIPPLLLASAAGKAPGVWQDYAAAVFIWIAIWLQPPYRMLYRVFPYPPPLQHTLSILLALSTAVAGYILVRRLEGAGYGVEWKPGFGTAFLFSFFIFAAIAIPLGLKIHFITFGPNFSRMHPLSLVVAAVGISFFTAWPEEFFFRGILQNCLTRNLNNKWLGLVAASVIFGFSHILHAPAPNWKYVLLATIAGLFYGRAYMKTGSIFPGVLVHGLVDFTWHILFR
ncbi:MAG TPA: type II CAAX endopeptidase family protein [Candidatus Acidoferrales bacterium]|nr:type II CAAX endopeptidase family protein [Candidatus Acidoferrales bacterium]